MRLCTFQAEGRSAPGRIEGERVVELAAPSLAAWLAQGGEEVAERPLAEVRLLAPIPRPPSVRDFYAFERHVAAGWRRRGGEIPGYWYEAPAFYFSNPASVMGPGEPVRRPVVTEMLDFELEIAAIVGGEGEIGRASCKERV